MTICSGRRGGYGNGHGIRDRGPCHPPSSARSTCPAPACWATPRYSRRSHPRRPAPTWTAASCRPSLPAPTGRSFSSAATPAQARRIPAGISSGPASTAGNANWPSSAPPTPRSPTWTLLPQAVLALGLTPSQVAQAIGTLDPHRAIHTQRDYVRDFFDLHLRHLDNHLLQHPSPRYPQLRFLRWGTGHTRTTVGLFRPAVIPHGGTLAAATFLGHRDAPLARSPAGYHSSRLPGR